MIVARPSLFRSLIISTALIVASAIAANGAGGISSATPSFGGSFALVGDFPLGAATTRTDYESIDATAHRLYISKMGSGELLVFDTARNTLLKQLEGYPKITGVLVVPELHRLYASVPGSGAVSSFFVGLGILGLSSGEGEVASVDTVSLREGARLPGGVFPDGIAYDAADRRIFVSDEFGGEVSAIDAVGNRVLARIDTGGQAGNVQYDPISARVYVAVQSRNKLVSIDPVKLVVVKRYRLEGCIHPHSVALAPANAIAYIACDENDVLLVVDLANAKVIGRLPAAHDPDVMAVDAPAMRLYLASESGTLSTFDLTTPLAPVPLGSVFVGEGAHAVAVDPVTHRLYFALADLNGRSVLRVIVPVK